MRVLPLERRSETLTPCAGVVGGIEDSVGFRVRVRVVEEGEDEDRPEVLGGWVSPRPWAAEPREKAGDVEGFEKFPEVFCEGPALLGGSPPARARPLP